MKWVIIKGVRYPSSVISAFAAYNMDNPFLKVRIRNKYHIVPFDDVNKWIDKNGSFDEAGGLDLVRHGYEWIRRMRKFENKADRHTFQKVFGNKRGNELWDYFLEVGRSIFILEDSYFLINDRNVFSLCLAECSDYDLYELVHNIDTDSDQGK